MCMCKALAEQLVHPPDNVCELLVLPTDDDFRSAAEVGQGRASNDLRAAIMADERQHWKPSAPLGVDKGREQVVKARVCQLGTEVDQRHGVLRLIGARRASLQALKSMMRLPAQHSSVTLSSTRLFLQQLLLSTLLKICTDRMRDLC